MDNDDRPVGRVLSRREVLALLGAAGAVVIAGRFPGALAQAAWGGTALGASVVLACVVRPEQTEGPYFVDERQGRSDIRVEPTDGSVKAGVPLALTFRIFQIGESCVPLTGATVDVWHCDAQGDYSDVTDRTEGFDTVGQTWLRGYQVTDENGKVTFKTIYPGWYRGRAVHIHFKIRTVTSTGASYEFTSQLFFDDALSDRVFTQEPYVTGEAREILNVNDMIFSDGGDQLLLALTESGEGYAATFDLGLDLTDADMGASDGGRGYPAVRAAAHLRAGRGVRAAVNFTTKSTLGSSV